jgi:hypothetical protein
VILIFEMGIYKVCNSICAECIKQKIFQGPELPGWPSAQLLPIWDKEVEKSHDDRDTKRWHELLLS